MKTVSETENETKEKYNLNFYEAMKVVMDGGAVKGDNFVDGIFMKLNSKGQLVTVDAGRLYLEETNVFIKGIEVIENCEEIV